MSKHIYQVHTRVFHANNECNELSEFYSSLKKAESALALLDSIYNRDSVDRHIEEPLRDDQVSKSIFFNNQWEETTDVTFRVIRILKVEVQ